MQSPAEAGRSYRELNNATQSNKYYVQVCLFTDKYMYLRRISRYGQMRRILRYGQIQLSTGRALNLLQILIMNTCTLLGASSIDLLPRTVTLTGTTCGPVSTGNSKI
eukprot:SAG31_NODE_3474_length_4233_cov_5.560716_7_plen_107_part_00